MTTTSTKTTTQNTLFARLSTFFGFKKTFSQRERMDLSTHRDAWLAKRKPSLEKKIEFYSY